jgi:hypothetical protein
MFRQVSSGRSDMGGSASAVRNQASGRLAGVAPADAWLRYTASIAGRRSRPAASIGNRVPGTGKGSSPSASSIEARIAGPDRVAGREHKPQPNRPEAVKQEGEEPCWQF